MVQLPARIHDLLVVTSSQFPALPVFPLSWLRPIWPFPDSGLGRACYLYVAQLVQALGSPGNYALSWGGNQFEKWGLGTDSSVLDGLGVGLEECPGQFWNPQVYGQPATCFCILLVHTALPCFWETQTIHHLAVDQPEPVCLSVVTE